MRTTRGWLDADTICTETTFEAALLAAGAAIEAVRRRRLRARPPAGAPRRARPGDGLLPLRLVAIAARWAQAELGIGRVAIVDWDVHHGNGTQDIVAGDDSILFVSLHQWPFYPGSGGPDEQGETLVNMPLPAGTGDDGYLAAWETVERAVTAFEPELCSSRPASTRTSTIRSPRCALTADGFRELARRSAQLAPRVAAVLEGGYNLRTLPDLVEAALEGSR